MDTWGVRDAVRNTIAALRAGGDDAALVAASAAAVAASRAVSTSLSLAVRTSQHDLACVTGRADAAAAAQAATGVVDNPVSVLSFVSSARAALGATMVNQAEYDRDAPKLLAARERTGALFAFASVEPMLGPIKLGDFVPDWIICGGESGPNAREMPLAGARDLRDQCAARAAPFFFKQTTGKGEIPSDLFVRERPPALHMVPTP